MKPLPIRLRLTLWYALLFAAAQIVFGVSAWVIVRQHLYSQADRELAEQVATAEHLIAANQHRSRDHVQREMAEEYEQETVGHHVQIIEASGDWLYRSPLFRQINRPMLGSSAEEPASPNGTAEFDAAGHHFRAVTRTISVGGEKYQVEAAWNADATQRILRLLASDLLLSIPFLVLVAAVGGYLVSRRALAPVDAIARTAQSIQETNLSLRLPLTETGDEIERLSVTLNEMLERLQQAFERTKQFTADASHELRTPVSLIRTEAELCLRRSRSNEEYRTALTHILDEAVRTSDLIETLLQLARADAGKAALQLESLHACPLVAEVTEGWRSIMEQSSLTLNVSLPREPAIVFAEPIALRRLLAILLDNARKYTPAGGRVTVTLEHATAVVKLQVRDTGIGIEPENTERIFDRFFRSDSVRGREGGAGLGLSLAQWIAGQHRGTLTVESTGSQGSCFTVSLPRVASSDAATDGSQTKVNERSVP